MSRFFDHDLNVYDTLTSIAERGQARNVNHALQQVVLETCMDAFLLRDLRIQAMRKRDRKRKGSLLKRKVLMKSPPRIECVNLIF